MNYDYLIIGAGISGAAAGFELAQHGNVVIVEAEPALGYHSTGRSAALFTPHYGPDLVRRICQSNQHFLNNPPEDFTSNALLTERGMLQTFPVGSEHAVNEMLRTDGEHYVRLTQKQTLSMAPFLRPEFVNEALYEQGVKDLDVNALYQGYLRGFKKRGGELLTQTRIEAMHKHSAFWEVQSSEKTLRTRIVVNAAGAWADEVGTMAGASTIGVQPKRRTAILIDVPDTVNTHQTPAIDFHGCSNYIKPEAGQLMVSPGDETLVTPQDIQPDDIEIAELVDWLETETTLRVSRVGHSWAGLRNFVADGLPVVGFDSTVEDFFWLAGQGGYGIMMAGPLALAATSLLTKNRLPKNLTDAGISAHQLSVDRLVVKQD